MRAGFAAALAAVLLIFGGPAAHGAPETVRIPAPGGGLDGLMLRPPGAGPHPAIVALHGCGGLAGSRGGLSARHADWGERLSRQGFLVLFPDSFGSRGLGSQCRVRQREIRASRERVGDVRAALAYLAERPDVDPQKINLLGWSNGGSTAIYAVQPRNAPRGSGRKVDFAAAVAFYPGCRLLNERGDWRTRVPLLVLSGEADDWTPAATCVSLIDRARRAGDTAEIVTYPGAYHNFDAPGLPVRVQRGLAFTGDGGDTAHSGTNEPARADALVRVPAFFRR